MIAKTKLSHSPAALFVALWRDAITWSGPNRVAAQPVDKTHERALRTALTRNNDGQQAYFAVNKLIGSEDAKNVEKFRGQVLAAMTAIDEIFYLIHPRAAVASPSSGFRSTIPGWLRDLRDERLITGRFYADRDLILIPRGPLLRGPRHPTASSADSLADRFAALTATPQVLSHNSRPIKVDLKVKSLSVATGAHPGSTAGAEAIVYIPVAEAADDLVAVERCLHNQKWVDFRPNPKVDASTCILMALEQAGSVDIAIAPEFMVCEAHADALAASLGSRSAGLRMLVAGTGATDAKEGVQSWNEARAVNNAGVELWRQRKIWPAGIDQARAVSFGITPPDDNTLVHEDNAAGNEISIVDIDGLGRCAILICQDLNAEPLSNALVSEFQPDWVFVPLLDTGVGIDRWMHRRAFELSARSQTRFVIVSSTSLAAKAGYPNPACAMAVGPLEPRSNPSTGDIPRAVKFEEAQSAGGARFAIISWRSGLWQSSTLRARST